MQFKKVLLRVIMSSFAAITAFSCITVDKSLGEEYLPEDQLLQVKTAEFNLPLTVKSMDSLQAGSASFGILGYIRTPEFGDVKVATAANLSQQTTDLNFGDDPVFISVYFRAFMSGTSVMKDGQEYIPQDIFVYRTTKKIDTMDTYINSIDPSFIESTPLNTATSTYFGGDTIKVFLKDEFGEELLTATEEELDSVDLFVERFNGLYVECSDLEEGLEGGRLNYISYGYASVVLEYNFQPEWEDDLDRKDTVIAFTLGDGYCVNPSTYSSKDLESTEALAELPIEGLAGVKPYLDGNTIKSMLDEWVQENGYDPSTVAISKAEFSLPFEIPADLDMTRYPTYLFPTYWNKDSTIKYYALTDDIYSTGNNMGYMSRSLEKYYGDFSYYIQDLITKDASEVGNDDNLWFAPVYDYYDSTYGTSYYYANTDYYYVGKINGPAADIAPSLKLVYAIVE